MARSLRHYRADVHSQNGEDGILEELLRRLSISEGWCCELGAWDGKHLSNTFTLVQSGWRAVLIEGDPEKYADLLKTQAEYPAQIQAIESMVTAQGSSSLDSILSSTPIPRDFEVLSVDVDGTDLLIWKGLQSYRPKIVVVEINSSIFPLRRMAPHQDGEDAGASFRSMLELARTKRYTLVAHTGNMVFLDDELAPQLGLPRLERAFPLLLFDPSWLPHDPVSELLRLALRLWHGIG